MASQRGRRATRRTIQDPDYDYGLGPSSSEQGSQNTVVSEQNDDSDSSYQENAQLSNAGEENVVADIQEGEQSSSEENENDQTPRARWLRKWKRSDPGLCCVCLDEDATKDNVLVYCDGKECDVVVHQECYGITTLPKKEDPWYCDRCLAIPSDAVRCVLCPNKNGAFRKIRASDEAGEPMVWVHILCAFWMPGMHIGSAADLRDIQVVNVDPKNWGKKCHVCNSEEGAAIHCDAGQCKNWVHATCAVAYGLTEYLDEENISDPYFIYCKQHGPNDHPRQNKIEKWIRTRDDFLANECLNRSEERNSQLQGGMPGQNLREIFEDAYAEYTSQREVRITGARRRIVQQASKHNGLIDAKEKIEKNVKDFRAKIPTVKVENVALKNYLEKANEAVLSLIPHMQNVQAEIHDGISSSAKIETLMEAMTGKANINWSKEIKRVAKSIKVKQLNINEVRPLNLKSVVSALARVAKEEKEKARQKGRRGGVKNRGRPKTPNKVKEKVVANQGEIQEGDDGDEQQTPKRNTRSRAANVKGKEKFTEDEVDTDNQQPQSQLKKVPRLRIVSRESQQTEDTIDSATPKREPKRKRVEPPTQNQLPDITTEVQVKRKRVQENLSTASTPTQSTNMTEIQVSRANTESSAPASATSATSAKRNTKRGKRKRVEELPSEVAAENERKRNNDQASASTPSDEVTKSVPVKRQYRRTRKSTNKEKKKTDEQTPAGTSNDQASASDTIQVKKPTKRARKSAKSNETAEDATNANDAITTTNVTSKRTRRKGKTTVELNKPSKLRPIAPKQSEIVSVLNTEEKGEGSTFHVVLNISKHKNDSTNSDPIEDPSNEVVTTTSMHGDVSNVITTMFDHNDNINKVESNEESSSNTRSGGVFGISTLLNPIEDTPSSTSTVYEASAQTYLYEAVNASANKQIYFGGNENLYQSSTSSNNVPIQSTGYYRYGSTSSTSAATTNTGRTPYEKYQTSFRVPLNVGVNESGINPYATYNQGAYSNPYFNHRSVTNYSFSSYTPMNQCMSYSNVNESRASGIFTNTAANNNNSTTKYTNVTSNCPSTSKFTNVTTNYGLNTLLSAVNFVELKAPETNSLITKEKHEVEPTSFIVKEKHEEVEQTSIVVKEKRDEVEPTSFVVKEKHEEVKPTPFAAEEKHEEVEPTSFAAEEKHEEVEPTSFIAEENHEEVEPISFVAEENHEEVEPISFVAEENHEVEPASFVAEEKHEEVEPTSFVAKENHEEVKPTSFAADEEVEPTSFVAKENHEEVVGPTSFVAQESEEVETPSFFKNNKAELPTSVENNEAEPPSFVENNETEPPSFFEPPTPVENNEVKPSTSVEINEVKPPTSVENNEVKPPTSVENNEVKPLSFVENKKVKIEPVAKYYVSKFRANDYSDVATTSYQSRSYTSTIKANPSGEVATSYQAGSFSFLSFTGPSTFSTSTIITQDDNAAAETLSGSSKECESQNVETVPVNTVPVNTVPVNTVPVNTVPVNTVPVNTAPVNTALVNTAPVNTAPVNTAPVNTAPVNTAPVDTAPVDTIPVDTIPVDGPVETAPIETALIETSSVEFVEDPVSPVQEITNNEELQSTIIKHRRKRGSGGIKKKAGRKPKAKPLEDEAQRIPVPQPTCSVCDLIMAPSSDCPSQTYVKPLRARESMLLKGRDKVNRMVRCGYCNKWYHLACMIPPRRTMPTGGYVWRCADCDQPSASTGESPSSGDAPSAPKTSKKWNLRSATR